MLNERYEYDQYTAVIDNKYVERFGKRLQYRLLSSNLTGISRPMQIIARGKIYQENEGISNTLEYLTNWFSGKNGWLIKYISEILPQDTSQEDKIKKIIENSIAKKNEEYIKPSFTMTPDPANDYNQIHYDKMISEALTAGKLSQYYLVADCAEDVEKNTKYGLGTDKYEQYVFENIAKPTPKKNTNLWCETIDNEQEINITDYRNDILMIIVAYLLKFNDCFSMNESLFIPSDFSNWRQKKNETARWMQYVICKKRLFSTVPLFQGKDKGSTKLIIHDMQWLKKCNWKLMKKEELYNTLEKSKKTLFYRDYYYGNSYKDHQDYVYGDKVGLIKRRFIDGKKVVLKRNSFYLNELDYWKEKGLV